MMETTVAPMTTTPAGPVAVTTTKSDTTTATLVVVALTEASSSASSNASTSPTGSNTSSNDSSSSSSDDHHRRQSLTPRSRVSKVLNRIKKAGSQQWRKQQQQRRSLNISSTSSVASEALSEESNSSSSSVLQQSSTFSFSDTSSLLDGSLTIHPEEKEDDDDEEEESNNNNHTTIVKQQQQHPQPQQQAESAGSSSSSPPSRQAVVPSNNEGSNSTPTVTASATTTMTVYNNQQESTSSILSVITSTTTAATTTFAPPDTTCLTATTQERLAVAVRGDLDDWFKTAHALLTSKEMQSFLKSSNRVVTSAIRTSAGTALTASGMVVKTAFLPVTLPLNVAASTTDLVINVAGDVLHHVTRDGQKDESSSCDQDGDSSEEKTYHTPAQDLLHHVFNFIPFVVQNTVKMVQPALGMPPRQLQLQVDVATVRPQQRSMSAPQSMTPNDRTIEKKESPDAFLQRLRLDIYPCVNEEFALEVIEDVLEEEEDDDDATTRTDTTESSASIPSSNPSGATKADFSKVLLRVDDVNVLAPPNPASDKIQRMLYVDLDKEFGDERITKDALAQLIQRGVDVASSNPAVHFSCTPMHQGGKSNTAEIEWKPEGKTKRDVKALSSMSENDFYSALRHKVLIWSGKYRGPKYHGSDNALFMARGVVNGCPREFTSMLWDSSRTLEYNNFCLGRNDVMVINDDFSSGGICGAKVIKSETKVPFTGLSVFLSAIMHVRALGDRPEDGFIILSRSLDTGRAGCHIGKRDGVDQSNKNEIILGANIMRPVPGHPELTDLLSVSQVSASMVPPFLAFRIGMMGVEDFFKNVRS